jgi:hypothetical protein
VGAFPLLLCRRGFGLRAPVLDELDDMLARHEPSVVRTEIVRDYGYSASVSMTSGTYTRRRGNNPL